MTITTLDGKQLILTDYSQEQADAIVRSFEDASKTILQLISRQGEYVFLNKANITRVTVKLPLAF